MLLSSKNVSNGKYILKTRPTLTKLHQECGYKSGMFTDATITSILVCWNV